MTKQDAVNHAVSGMEFNSIGGGLYRADGSKVLNAWTEIMSNVSSEDFDILRLAGDTRETLPIVIKQPKSVASLLVFMYFPASQTEQYTCLWIPDFVTIELNLLELFTKCTSHIDAINLTDHVVQEMKKMITEGDVENLKLIQSRSCICFAKKNREVMFDSNWDLNIPTEEP